MPARCFARRPGLQRAEQIFCARRLRHPAISNERIIGREDHPRVGTSAQPRTSHGIADHE
jgi:hypothetical protein